MADGKKGILAVLGLLGATNLLLQLVAVPAAKRTLTTGPEGAVSLRQVIEAALPAAGPSLLVAGGVLAGLVLLEIRGRPFRSFLAAMLRSPRDGLVLTVLGSAMAALVILGPGRPIRGDSSSHLLRAAFFLDVVRAGELPLWAPQWYGGTPFAQFYSPLENVVFALFGAITGNVDSGAKIALYLAHVVAAIGIFRLVLRLTANSVAAWFASLCFTVMRSHLATVLFHGNFPGAFFLALAPYLFLSAYDLARRPRAREIVRLAVLLSGAVVCHVAYLRPLTPAWILFSIFLVLSPGTDRHARSKTLRALALAHVLAAALSAFLLVPLLVEEHLVRFPSAYRWFPLPSLEFVTHLVRWSVFHPAYQGIGILLIAAFALDGAWRRRGDPALVLVAAAIVTFALWWPDKRAHYFDGFLLATVAGLGAHRLMRRAPRAWPTILLVLVAVVLVEQGPFLLMNTYVPPRPAEAALESDLAEIVRGGPNPYGRVLTVHAAASSVEFDPWRLYRSRSIDSLGGPFLQGTPRSFDATGLMLGFVAQKLNAAGRPDSTAARGLALLDVSAVVLEEGAGRIVRRPQAGDLWMASPRSDVLLLRSSSPVCFFDEVRPLSDLTGRPEAAAFREEPPGTPAAAAEDTVGWHPFDPGADYASTTVVAAVEALELDPSRNRGKTMFVADRDAAIASAAPRERTARSSNGAAEQPLRVLDTSRSLQSRAYDVDVPEAGYLRLNENFYPIQDVRLDGAPVEAVEDALGGILFAVDAGRHHVERRPRWSILRAATALGSAIVLVLAMAWVLISRNRP